MELFFLAVLLITMAARLARAFPWRLRCPDRRS